MSSLETAPNLLIYKDFLFFIYFFLLREGGGGEGGGTPARFGNITINKRLTGEGRGGIIRAMLMGFSIFIFVCVVAVLCALGYTIKEYLG